MMFDAVPPWLKLAALVTGLVLVFRLVRRHAVPWTWSERKIVLYALTFGTLPIVWAYSALRNAVSPDVLAAIGITLLLAVIVSFFAVVTAPERGHEAEDTIKAALIGILRVVAAILIPMLLTLAFLGLF
jgi:hypothetical protein